MLINHVSLNGNLLMNVGPTSRGYLDHRAIDALDGFAEWMKYHNRAIYGCGAAPDEFQAPKDCRYTWNPVTRRLYVHFFCWPFKHIHLHNLAGKVRYAQFLNDGSEVQIRVAENAYNHAMNSCTPDGAITLELPVIKPHATIPVVELFLA